MPVIKRLRGYCDILDLRPIHFQETLPDHICCSVCDVIPGLLLGLPCGHKYCGACYDQIATQRPARCPLDQVGYGCNCVGCDSDRHYGCQCGCVSRIFVLKPALENKKVRCINANEGCPFVGSLNTLKEHFQVSCQFHVVTCGRCAQHVPRKRLIEHLSDDCRSGRTLSELKKTKYEVGRVIDKLSAAKCAAEDNINSVLACTQAYAKVTNDLQTLLEDCLPRLHQAEKQILQRIGSVAVFEPSLEGQRRSSCLLRNFSAKLRSAASYTSDSFNVAGYPIQVGQTFVGGFADQLYVYLSLLTSVRRTTENSSQWPIRKTFFLILVHPEDSGKNIKHAIMPSEVEHVDVYFTRIRDNTNKKKIQRPLDKWFKTSKLQSDGFVVDDALRVTVEVEG
ncbi:uncharacterized protein LOC115310715 [Ixodes scapularis]|uniref:uncharacterized protein LOC115310715 n=1 Tax=Ixodes scapularis TaxID=6945 RepID=UPI001A9D32B6|nr:uncharacterized protein LOC115310715 [Ixodes scapularis]